jgi:hypothetical protein
MEIQVAVSFTMASVGSMIFGSSRSSTRTSPAVFDAPLDGVALLVGIGIEAGRTAALAAPPQTVADLVGRLWDDRADLSATQVAADCAG